MKNIIPVYTLYTHYNNNNNTKTTLSHINTEITKPIQHGKFGNIIHLWSWNNVILPKFADFQDFGLVVNTDPVPDELVQASLLSKGWTPSNNFFQSFTNELEEVLQNSSTDEVHWIQDKVSDFLEVPKKWFPRLLRVPNKRLACSMYGLCLQV